MKKNKIELVAYDEFWQKVFAKETQNISKILRNNLIECFHIGATAIPSIKARPTLDIMIVVHTLDGILSFKNEFQKMGLTLDESRSSITNYFFIRKAPEDRGSDLTHINILEHTNEKIGDMLDFRDYLNSEEQVAKEYQTIREALTNDEKKYNEAKEIFITTTLNALKNSGQI